jgi:ABC-type spermidine/putrescine transport system permease subunit II
VNVRRHAFVFVLSVLALLFLWAPLAMVVVNAFNRNELLTSWDGLTFRWFRQAVGDGQVRDALRQTLEIAVLCTAVTLPLAVTAVLWWRRAPRRNRRWFDALVYLNVILPEVVFASAIFLLFVRLHVETGLLAVVIGHSVWTTAYAILILQARLSALDPALEEAAADLGAGAWEVFRRVTMPGLLPGVLVATLIVFTFSFDDVVTSFFLAGSQVNTLPLVLFGLIRFHVTPEINAIGVLVMTFTASVTLISYLILSKVNRLRRGALPAGLG